MRILEDFGFFRVDINGKVFMVLGTDLGSASFSNGMLPVSEQLIGQTTRNRKWNNRLQGLYILLCILLHDKNQSTFNN